MLHSFLISLFRFHDWLKPLFSYKFLAIVSISYPNGDVLDRLLQIRKTYLKVTGRTFTKN